MAERAELVLDARAELGEGPLWDPARRRVLFVDIMRGHVHVFDPVDRSDRIVDVGRPVGVVACTTRGDWIAAAAQGFCRIDPDTGAVTPVAEAAAGRTDVRMNDGNVDPLGSFWAGTAGLEPAADAGALYRLDPGGRVETVLEPVTTSNGIDWTPDGRLVYYVDTRTRRIDVFDFDGPARRLLNRRTFVDLTGDAGRPDGLVVDAEGGIWVALWRGGAVRRYTPDGRLDEVIELPTALVTKCAFAGPALDDLYITTALRDLSPVEQEAQPSAGGLFHVRPGRRGQPPRVFRG